jgi:hypothetical protein
LASLAALAEVVFLISAAFAASLAAAAPSSVDFASDLAVSSCAAARQKFE